MFLAVSVGRAPFEAGGQPHRRIRLARRAQFERLQRAVQQCAVGGRHDCAERVLEVSDSLGEAGRRAGGDGHHAAQKVGMAVQHLGRGMHDHMDTVLDGPLAGGRGKGTVADRDGPGFRAEPRHERQIDDAQRRVGRRLEPEQVGPVFRHRPFERFRVGKIHEADLVARRGRAHIGKQAVDAAVKVVMGEDGRPGGQGFEQGRRRRQAAREDEGRFRAFQIGEAELQGIAGRVAAAGVVEALAAPDALLHVGRGVIDGRDHRAGERVRLLPDMDGARCESGLIAGKVVGHVLALMLREPVSQPGVEGGPPPVKPAAAGP